MRSPRPVPDPVAPGKESVWDYPRPPRLEPCARRLRVVSGDVVLADTRRGFRVLETSHPPSYYLPPDDCDMARFVRAEGSSFCEWKGRAEYWDVRTDTAVVHGAAWSYPAPTAAFEAIRDHIACHPAAFDCFVDDEAVRPQPGGFYGGWVTSDIGGPIKGPPGTEWW
ncbi:MAG: DUF427 domain-containing protein [Acidimicrobiales bacterium]